MTSGIRVGDGDERTPAGEDQGLGARFGAQHVAAGFGVEVERVHRAMEGEFGLGPDATVDSKQAQLLVEVLIGDLPIDRQEAALMRLGAFTPRRDDDWGLGDTAPGEESDRLSATADHPEDVTPSPRASNDPSYMPTRHAKD